MFKFCNKLSPRYLHHDALKHFPDVDIRLLFQILYNEVNLFNNNFIMLLKNSVTKSQYKRRTFNNSTVAKIYNATNPGPLLRLQFPHLNSPQLWKGCQGSHPGTWS